MLHNIHPEEHGPLGEEMAAAVSTCVHCGFCLAACPTYQELGQEADSPRGRIVLMKEVLEGTLPLEDRAAAHRSLPGMPGVRAGVPVGGSLSRFDQPLSGTDFEKATSHPGRSLSPHY